MTGITYAIAEIILFLAIAAGLGFFIGRLTVRTAPASSSDSSRVKDLEAQVASLRATSATAVEPPPTDAALRKDLEVATWEIEALQEEVARLRNANADGAGSPAAVSDDTEAADSDDEAEGAGAEGEADHETGDPEDVDHEDAVSEDVDHEDAVSEEE